MDETCPAAAEDEQQRGAREREDDGEDVAQHGEAEQHPHEDMIDPLRGGLKLELPEGRTPPPNLRRVGSRFCGAGDAA